MSKKTAKAKKKAPAKKAAKKKAPTKTPAPEGKGTLRRIAQVESTKTGRTVSVDVDPAGKLRKGDMERTGVEKVDEFWAVRAPTRPEVRKLAEAGEGVRFRRAKNGKVVEAAPKK